MTMSRFCRRSLLSAATQLPPPSTMILLRTRVLSCHPVPRLFPMSAQLHATALNSTSAATMSQGNPTQPTRHTFDPKSDPSLAAFFTPDWQSFQLPSTPDSPSTPTSSTSVDWVSQLDLSHTTNFLQQQLAAGTEQSTAPRVLVLYGSLRPTSYSRRLALEFARVLTALGANVLVYHPHHLPLHSSALHPIPQPAQELRQLAYWSAAMVFVSNEQHGGISGVMKNQLDWIPLYEGSRSPTEGKLLAVAQVNGSGQSYNACNTLRVMGRWMRMLAIPAQSSIAQCHFEFDSSGRLKAGVHRDRLVDVCEELVKATVVMGRFAKEVFVERYSVREEKRRKEETAKQAENQRVTEQNVDDPEGMKKDKQ